MTEDEMVGWHHQPNEHESVQTLGNSEGKGSRECFSPWESQKVGHDYMTKEQKINKNRMLVRAAECCFHYVPDACP